jgi:hypothetical protein
MSTLRIMLIRRVSAAIMLGAVLFEVVACSAPPYHPARASILTFAYLVISLGAILLVYRVRSARQHSPDLGPTYPAAMGGLAVPSPDPRAARRETRVALAAVAAISGLTLLSGFSHGFSLRECTTPVRGWLQTSATVIQVYTQWHDGSRTYIAVARYRDNGQMVYFTAPETADPVYSGDKLRVAYPPGNSSVLHDLSAGHLWRLPVYTSLIAIAIVLAALVAGLTLTDRKRIQRRDGTVRISGVP